MMKSKPLSAYLSALPEKKLTLTLEKPNACVRDYDEGEFDSDLVVLGVMIDGQPYVDGFETTTEIKNKLREIAGGAAVTVTLVADDGDPDSFPSITE